MRGRKQDICLRLTWKAVSQPSIWRRIW